tara:strand:- start:8225 stop:8698 length:474 start_codon:yes stop_codon:yes gene_type:complete
MRFSKKDIDFRYQKTFNGKEKIRLGVAVALINLKNEILLEKRTDCEWWGVTGGKLDLGETVQECAIREIKEECNLVIEEKNLTLLGVYSNPKEGRILQYPDNRVHLIDVVYTLKNNFQNLKKSEESLELKFFSFDNLPNLIVPPAITPLIDMSKLYK